MGIGWGPEQAARAHRVCADEQSNRADASSANSRESLKELRKKGSGGSLIAGIAHGKGYGRWYSVSGGQALNSVRGNANHHR